MFFKKKKEETFKEFYKNFLAPFKEEGDKLLSVIEVFEDGILFLDENQKIVLINPKAEEILEAKRDDLFNKSPLKLNHLPNFKPLVPFLIEKEKIKKEIMVSNNHYFSLSIVPVYSQEKFLGTIATIKDITQLKMNEKAKSNFVTLAAHQFRTPTSAIKWALSTLLKGNSDNLTAQQLSLLQKTYDMNMGMINLINNFLNFVKTEKGELLLKPILVQFEDFVLKIVKENRERIEMKQLKLNFRSPSESFPKIMIDPVKMKVVVENILDNAIRYTQEKGTIDIYFRREEEEINVYFQDSGRGIPKSQQDNVFSYFFRGSNIVQVYTEGIGLGLFLAKSIIEAHEGRIWFESVENRGSLFAFSLPIKKDFDEFITKDFY